MFFGADMNATDNRGNTPLHVAAERGRKEVVQILLELGAAKYEKNNEKETHITLLKSMKGIPLQIC